MSVSVSVIVPVYNVEKYLRRCIDSVLAQTLTDFELILVDDGSPDESGKICEEYALKDDRIRVIHKTNDGVSSARNIGIESAIGEYLAFIDSDDCVDSDYLETFWKNQTDLTLSMHITFDESGKKLWGEPYQEYECHNVLEMDYTYLCNKLYSPYCRLYKRSSVENNKIRFPLGITWGEDGMFAGEYIKHVRSVHVIPYSGYHYVKYNSADSLSTKVREDIVDMVTTSRESYLQSLKEIVGLQFDEIKKIIEMDIKWNCVYFVNQLFYSRAMSMQDKKKILKRFMNNSYVQDTIKAKEVFYKDSSIVLAFSSADPIKKYEVLFLKRRLINKIKRVYHYVMND